MDGILGELTCPITLSLLEDPISVPCCGKAFGRAALLTVFESVARCPLCNGDLSEFDAEGAAGNVVLSALTEAAAVQAGAGVEANTPQQQQEQPPPPPTHEWSASLSPVVGKDNTATDICELSLRLRKGKFTPKPSLFIAVVDKSGSMAGSPWRQVQSALVHMTGVTSSNPLVKTVMITYDSYATILETAGKTDAETRRMIEGMSAGGGTNFLGAYEKIATVLEQHKASGTADAVLDEFDVSNVTIAFLTDGQTYSKETAAFERILSESWTARSDVHAPISVHSVGFGSGCDKAFLEDLRKLGTTHGTFRYAEPSDDGDTLSHKLNSLFEIAAQSSCVQISLRLPEGLTAFPTTTTDGTGTGTETNTLDLQFPVDRKSNGELRQWVVSDGTVASSNSSAVQVVVNSLFDEDCMVELKTPPSQTAGVKTALLNKWLNVLVDQISAELMALCTATTTTKTKVGKHSAQHLHMCLLEQRIEAIRAVGDAPLQERLAYLAGELQSLKDGVPLKVNLGKLSDSRFGSRFAGCSIAPQQTARPLPVRHVDTSSPPTPDRQLTAAPSFTREYRVSYTFSADARGRNNLQENLMQLNSTVLSTAFEQYLARSSVADVMYCDDDGNNALHLMAYAGQYNAMEEVLQSLAGRIRSGEVDVDCENNDGETPLTLSIKARGFWKVMKLLLEHGATFPAHRVEGLQAYAVDNRFTVTAAHIAAAAKASEAAGPLAFAMSMTCEYISFQYEAALESGRDVDVPRCLEVALAKRMPALVAQLLAECNDAEVATPDMLLTHCIPKKADDPLTEEYLALTRLLVAHRPALLHATNADGDTPLIKSAEKGSLPHVAYFLAQGCAVDARNALGNTALWVACAKCYPCIIAALIDAGADVNAANLKGNPPLYGSCQRGPVKIAEQLLACGAEVEGVVNRNGDTLILLCCRNGRHEVLKLLLQRVAPSFVAFKADVDGFDAMLACAEADQPHCIETLHAEGIPLDTTTDACNAILPSATPLHVAAYYGRLAAARTLLTLGADADARDISGRTPLHIAVLQGEPALARLLREHGADVDAKDDAMSTPAAYCTDDAVRSVLVDPALDCLMGLAGGLFPASEVSAACSVLREHAGARGCLAAKTCVDLHGTDNATPLLRAILHGQVDVARVLLDLGADPAQRNALDVNSFTLAKWCHSRVCAALPWGPGCAGALHATAQLARLQHAASLSSADAQVLFLQPQAQDNDGTGTTASGIQTRMEQSANLPLATAAMQEAYTAAFTDCAGGQAALVKVVESMGCLPQSAAVWRAKAHVVDLVASGNNMGLTPQEALLLSLHTSSAELAHAVNCLLWADQAKVATYVAHLNRALQKLPAHTGEVFVGARSVDRRLFTVGSEVTTSGYVFGSALWRVATGGTDFASKSKSGTVFLLKSKSGRHIGHCSQHAYNAEVMFPPCTSFKVTSWYRGDVICLGQANIREHTFKVKDDCEMQRLLASNKSLIIELQEQ